MQRRAFLIRAALAALILFALAPSPRAFSSSDVVGFVNHYRTERHLRRLLVSTDLSGAAERHSRVMARKGDVFHTRYLGSSVCCWLEVGENVGAGNSVDEVDQAFINSPEHRENILWPTFQQIGVGVAWRGDIVYVTQLFRRPSSKPSRVHAPVTPQARLRPLRGPQRAVEPKVVYRGPGEMIYMLERLRALDAALEEYRSKYVPMRREVRTRRRIR